MASNQSFQARKVLEAMLELKRRGPDAVIRELEQLEPDLSEYLLESTSQFHHDLLKLGLPAKRSHALYRQAEAITLVCVLAIRQAGERRQLTGSNRPPARKRSSHRSGNPDTKR